MTLCTAIGKPTASNHITPCSPLHFQERPRSALMKSKIIKLKQYHKTLLLNGFIWMFKLQDWSISQARITVPGSRIDSRPWKGYSNTTCRSRAFVLSTPKQKFYLPIPLLCWNILSTCSFVGLRFSGFSRPMLRYQTGHTLHWRFINAPSDLPTQ